MQELIQDTQLPNENKEPLEFFPLNISLLERITPMLAKSKHMLCDYTPGGLLFGMRRLYSPAVCVRGDVLFVSLLSEDRTHREYLIPTSADAESLEMLREYARAHRLPLAVHGTESATEYAAKYYRCGYELSDELCDYVFDARSLATLEGAKYHTQRTNIRKLQREHESWRYERINGGDLADAVAFADSLFAQYQDDGSKYYSAGVEIVYDSLANLERLSLRGGLLRVDGEVCGVAVGFVKHRMLYIHVLRARREVWGAWNLLCREFVLDNLADIDYVNMEDDLGDEGIRRMKMSYSPIEFIKRAKTTVI